MSSNGFEMSEPVSFSELIRTPDMVNISGQDDEPLWVAVDEVAAIGVHGTDSSLVVLRSGTKLVAKSKHPNEVLGLVMGVGDDSEG